MPYSLADAHAILRCLIPALSTLAENFDRVILKAHPTASQSTLERYIEKYWLGSSLKIEWSNETVGALLPSARVVVSTQSSAMLEAICIGAWVIVVGRSAGITVNPLEDIDRRLWRLVYDSGELLEAIQEGNSHHALSRPERIAIGNSIRLAHFEPTNEISMRAFLPACADKAVNGSVQL